MLVFLNFEGVSDIIPRRHKRLGRAPANPLAIQLHIQLRDSISYFAPACHSLGGSPKSCSEFSLAILPCTWIPPRFDPSASA